MMLTPFRSRPGYHKAPLLALSFSVYNYGRHFVFEALPPLPGLRWIEGLPTKLHMWYWTIKVEKVYEKTFQLS